jgi:serine-type D-Ala-D-Ala carboxypeptidase/endopeptidase (penicillin-binding protein 4)
VTRPAAGLAALFATLLGASAAPAIRAQVREPAGQAAPASAQDATLADDLDRLFADPTFARALVGIRIESLTTGRLLYERNGQKLVVPGSNMKLLTMAVTAEKLGWDYTFETRLEAAGRIQNGVLHGDLIVTGSGDPSIVAQDLGAAALFGEWAAALRAAGVRRVDGRILGDDHAFDEEGLGAGWAWDYLTAAYAAPSGALSYNENTVVARIAPGAAAGEPARVELLPPGSGLELVNEVETGAPGSALTIDLTRMPGSARLTVRGRIPAGRRAELRTTTVRQPTRFFVEAFRLALAERGITVSGGAWDLDDVEVPAPAARQTIATRRSLALSYLAGYFMKVSQNFYGETFLKTLGRTTGRPGSAATGRQVVRETLAVWGVPADAFVMNDGSGLSRYDYVTADAIVTILKHIWHDARLRGPFLATLPVGAHDGTLETRMRGTVLDGRVQAKTGTISNMRALSGYLETKSGERIVFSIIANHFTAPNAEVDAIVEKALARVAER